MSAPRPPRLRLLQAYFASLLAMGVPSVGHAQTPTADEARAQALYDEGTKRLDAGDLKEACPRLEEAVRLVPDAGGAHLALGVCLERSGRLASALVHYERAVAFSDPFPDRKQRAQISAAQIRPRVPKLLVEISAGAPPHATVRVDGLASPHAEPILLDAGSHTVELVHGERAVARDTVVLTDGALTRLSIGAASPALPANVGKPASTTGAPSGEEGREGAGGGGPPLGVLGVVAIGAGGAGLILGAVAGSVAAERDSASDEACDERDFCTEEGYALRDEAFTWATVSTVGLIVGGALATTGIVLVVVDGAEADPPSSARPRSSPRVTARVGPAGVSIHGGF